MGGRPHHINWVDEINVYCETSYRSHVGVPYRGPHIWVSHTSTFHSTRGDFQWSHSSIVELLLLQHQGTGAGGSNGGQAERCFGNAVQMHRGICVKSVQMSRWVQRNTAVAVATAAAAAAAAVAGSCDLQACTPCCSRHYRGTDASSYKTSSHKLP